jgi:hypothetical protein
MKVTTVKLSIKLTAMIEEDGSAEDMVSELDYKFKTEGGVILDTKITDCEVLDE